MKHDRTFDPSYGTPIELADGIRRLTAQNPGPFTFFGTNSYIIGTDDVVILDPGPGLPRHQDALKRSVAGQTVRAILVSHTHKDHSPSARGLAESLDAPLLGCAPHYAARALETDEINALDASADRDYRPDEELTDSALFSFGGSQLEAIATPGHTANHLCFALLGTEFLFSADHVMGWATTVVAPPDGSMVDYMASLEKLMKRRETRFFPGHGGVISEAGAYMKDLHAHRTAREAAIAACLGNDALSIPEIVMTVYVGLDPALRPAAALSVLAHLESLVALGRAVATPGPTLDAKYTLA